MAKRKRVKRASADSLYKTCKAAGTCPADVINKIEGSTIADKILQYGSLGVYLGGLGIGTGSGTGGRTGYTPLRPSTGGRPTSLGPVELPKPPAIAVEESLVTANDPSVIPMVELPSITEPTVVGGGNGGDPVTVTPDIPILTHETPNVTVGGDDVPPAVLDINPTVTTVTKYRVTQSKFHNPLFYEGQSHTVGEASSSTHTLIRGGTSQSTSLSESIELQTFSPKTSTPLSSITRGHTALKLYSKSLNQVNVANPNFIKDPLSLFAFENPAFNIEETLDFDPEDAAAVTDPQFLDIIKLHRPALTSTRRGAIRFSRIGQKSTMTTRSGKKIGAKIHFFKDLSSIQPSSDDIELQPMFSTNTPNINSTNNNIESLDFSMPYDGIEEVDIFTGSPSTPLEFSRQSISVSGTTLSVNYPHTQVAQTFYTPSTRHPIITPGETIHSAFWQPLYSDFYLHPGYRLKKRKPKVFM
ncbi:L2 protein [Tursiops truncatus papillomavirus 8]|nr:L2 protein [Tursiops truncatus papillomavirus 8]